MRNKRKIILGVASWLLILSLIVAGCGSADSTKNNAEQSNTPNNNADTGSEELDWSTVKADIRLVYPGTTESEKVFAETFKEDMKVKYPNINIELIYLSWADMDTKLPIMINSGDVPDITATQDITNYVQMGAFEDLWPYIEREDSTINEADFLPGTLDYSTVDGKLYSIPGLANSFSLMVNEEMLAEVGMKVEDLQTWEDVEKAAELMTKDGKYGYGYPLSVARFAFRVPFTAGYSNDLLLDDTSEESKQKYIELLTHLENLEPYNPKAHLTWGYPEMFRAYSNGEVGMIPAGTFFTANVYSINPDIINVTRAIAYPKGPSGSAAQAPVSNVGYAIFKDSPNKEVAWKLLQELSSPEYNSLSAAIVNITALKSTSVDSVIQEAESIYPKAIDGHKRVLEDFNSMLDQSGVPMAKIVGQPEMETIVQEQVAKLLTGKSDVEEAYNGIKQGIDSVKERYAR